MARKNKTTKKNPSVWTEEVTVVTPWLLVTLIVITGVFAVLQYIS